MAHDENSAETGHWEAASSDGGVQSMPVMTVQARFVLLVLLQAPPRGMFGLEIASRVNQYPSTVYKVLRRLWEAGWIVRRVGSAEERTRPGRPKLFYRLTTDGAILARDVLIRDLTPVFATLADRLGLSIPTPDNASEKDRC